MTPDNAPRLEDPQTNASIEDFLPFLRNVARNAYRKYHSHYTQDDVEDSVQDVVLSLLKNDGHGLHSFEGRSSIQEWLRSVGYHEVLRSIRRQKPTISLEDTTPDDPANPPNQEDEIWIEEIKKLFAEMACELTEHERQLLEFIKEGLKTGEIAALTGIDPGSVSKAKRRLLDKLEERIRTKLDGEAGAGKSGKNKPPEE